MTFSSELKKELSKLNTLADKEIVKYEFLGYLLSNNITLSKTKIRFSTENEYNINRFHKLLDNLNMDYDIEIQGNVYSISFSKDIFYIEDIIKIKDEVEFVIDKDKLLQLKEDVLKAIIRGVFLGSGSINDPNKKYHLEIILTKDKNREYLIKILNLFHIVVKKLDRPKTYSIYIKDGEEISQLLAFMGASKAVLTFEEIRVVREMRNNINRLVNCETSNLNKTIHASVRQIEEINIIKKKRKI